MKTVIKNRRKTVEAWCLGRGSAMEERLVAEGKILRRRDGTYELFSQEATGGQGEHAKAGDYFKVDDAGYPYPNAAEYFAANHRHVEGDLYEQPAKPLSAWFKGDAPCAEVDFLVERGLLQLHPETPQAYFRARLWGADLTAGEDAALVFYSVERSEDGTVTGAEFNFVARAEFEATYTMLKST